MILTFNKALLGLRHTFTIANFSRHETPVVFTQIRIGDVIGYGEAAMPPYLGESHETAVSFLSKIDLSQFALPIDINDIMQYVNAVASANTAAKASIDIALHDLKGKVENVSVWTLLGSNQRLMPVTSFTLGMDKPEIIRQKVEEAKAFKVLKLKLGGENDKEIVNTVRSVTDKPLFIDANQGWKDKYLALDMCDWLEGQGAVLIEQPMPKDRIEDSAWVQENTSLPIIADESFQRLSDLPRIQGAFRGINIKLMKCTGLNEAKKIVTEARALGLKILMGSMTESSCACLAGAALAPQCDWADLDGPWLISNNPFNTPLLKNGKIILSAEAGLGLKLI